VLGPPDFVATAEDSDVREELVVGFRIGVEDSGILVVIGWKLELMLEVVSVGSGRLELPKCSD